MVCEVQCTARVRNLCANGLRDSCGHASARGPGVRLCRAREGLRTSAGAQRLCAQAVFRCCVKFSSSSYRGSHWQSALGPRGQPGAVGCLGERECKVTTIPENIATEITFFMAKVPGLLCLQNYRNLPFCAPCSPPSTKGRTCATSCINTQTA